VNAVPSQLHFSIEDWIAFEEQHPELKHELIEGAVYAMAGASNRHNDVAAAVFGLIWPSVREHGCRAVASDQRLVIRDRNGFYPDVAVFCDEPDDGQYRRQPCLLVEVVSPSSRQRDYETKAIAYLQIPSLLAYLIVDPARNVVEAHLRDDVGQPWRSVSLPSGSSLTLICPPVVIDVDDLFV
jgi:Uma2 family endonuclease